MRYDPVVKFRGSNSASYDEQFPALGTVSAEAKTLPPGLALLTAEFKEIDVTVDPITKTLWCYMRPNGPPSFTPSLLRELHDLHGAMRAAARACSPGEERPVLYYVQGSRMPGIFNMGGDLAYFASRIRARDPDALRFYAYDCVDAIYRGAVGFDAGAVSIALVQGDALGGGFECALSGHVLVAERGAKLGLPEILFNSFPGMGAYSLLTRRIGAVRAERIITSGKLYSAEELHDLGVVDILVDDGKGEQAVRDYIGKHGRGHAVREALFRVRQRVHPVTIEELRDIADIWVENAMQLRPADLRRMEHLQNAQGRRMVRPRAVARSQRDVTTT